MREAVIVEAVRTPIGKRNGKLKDVHPVVLGSLVLKELIKRAGIKPELVDDVVFGCVAVRLEPASPALRGQSHSVGRLRRDHRRRRRVDEPCADGVERDAARHTVSARAHRAV